MGNYRNFSLVVYFVAAATEKITREELQKQIDFFAKYMRLDKVYLEPYRGGSFASEEQVRMCKEVFEANGIAVEGGITTCAPTPEGEHEKQRLFDTLCYNDEKMLERLRAASELNGKVFDAFIIDDFYFTNCTCDKCRKEHEEYNKAHGITDGSWQDYRTAKMYEVSKEYMIKPAKALNPNCKITIKYPNWMESYQETGYDPLSQKDIFEYIYTGTETRDPRHQDQHLPRYLSFSLMKYMDAMAPGRNGGGWFDPFDCQITEYYLEQAYLTAFAKPRELMMFCFQALYDSMNAAALGFQLDKLDALLDNLGEPVGIPCYIPNASQGEDNIYDHLGMNGFPVIPVPFFPEDAKELMLTASSAYDKQVVDKLEKFVAAGGKAIVTSGFLKETLGKGLGIENMTSFRDRGRKVTVSEFIQENANGMTAIPGWQSVRGADEITFPVMEFRNNSTWGALCKGLKNEESYTLLARDTYGDGQMMTIVVPDAFPDFGRLPAPVLYRLRKEFDACGIVLEGDAGIGLFIYDNDTFVVYPYATSNANDADVLIHINGHVKDLTALNNRWIKEPVKPLYERNGETVFAIRTRVGKYDGWKINR